MNKKIASKFTRDCLIAVFVILLWFCFTNFKEVFAWHGRLHTSRDCEKAVAELDVVPDSQVIESKINGQETRRLDIAWEDETAVSFSAYIHWNTGEDWFSSKNVYKPDHCEEPTPTPSLTPTQTPTITPTPTLTPTPTPTPTPEEEEEPESRCVGLSASPTEGTAPLTVRFNGSGFDEDGEIQRYKFDFGDDSGGQPQVWEQDGSVSYHRYEYAGTYTAALHVRDSRGNWRNGNEDCKIAITVSAEPQVLAASSKGGLPETGVDGIVTLALLATGPVGVFLYKKNKLV
jgi:hypothetical protein